MLNDKTVLISGGTGSFGRQCINSIFERYPDVKRVIIFSRDELKQFELKQQLAKRLYPQLGFFIGDVRDRQRLIQACEQVDVIIHAAALKQVDTAEYNPTECIRTNVDGAENIIHAALQCKVTDIVALSTDKACAPINLYGATKLLSDKLFTAANNIKGSKNIRFSVVRYGNVMGSRGSVIPLFLQKRHEGKLPITHSAMTRFNISLQAGVNMVLFALQHHLGGEIFVPKIASYRLIDLANAIAPECEQHIVGMRPGEKLHEEMISDTDALHTIDLGKYYAILPTISATYSEQEYLNHHKAKKVPFGFKYNSYSNNKWESVESLRDLIKTHIDSNFSEGH